MKFIAILWSNWRWNTSRISSNTSKNTKNENDENLFYHLTQFYQQIYSILMKLLSDNSYEVQILSCKIIGELITSHSFWLDNEIFSYILHIDHHIIYENLHNLLQICLQSLENLLESPKIPVSDTREGTTTSC